MMSIRKKFTTWRTSCQRSKKNVRYWHKNWPKMNESSAKIMSSTSESKPRSSKFHKRSKKTERKQRKASTTLWQSRWLAKSRSKLMNWKKKGEIRRRVGMKRFKILTMNYISANSKKRKSSWFWSRRIKNSNLIRSESRNCINWFNIKMLNSKQTKSKPKRPTWKNSDTAGI